MTVEPASTRANRINSDSLDWSYIGISVTVGHSTSARRAEAAIHGSFTVDPEPMAADGQRYAGPDASICEARASACVSTYSRMLVSLPSRTVMAKIQSSSNVLFVALIFPLGEADDQDPVSLRYELPGFRGRFYRLGCRLKQIRQPGVSVVRSGQRPVLARNDPLDVFGDQRQQSLPVAAADRGEEVLHGLDVLLNAHRNFSISLGSDRARSDPCVVPPGDVVFIRRT